MNSNERVSNCFFIAIIAFLIKRASNISNWTLKDKKIRVEFSCLQERRLDVIELTYLDLIIHQHVKSIVIP